MRRLDQVLSSLGYCSRREAVLFVKNGRVKHNGLVLTKADQKVDPHAVKSKQRLLEVIALVTGAIEIKSGYGLSLESELQMLRVFKRLKELNLIPVKATFLGAHAVPAIYKGKKEGYLKLILNEILPEVAKQKLADYIDIFCEQNYFTANETATILEKGAKFGLQGKVHAEQLSHSGGIQAAVKCNAVSVDHLEFCNDEDIEVLKNSNTIPTILPRTARQPGPPA